jgi:transcriptional regulator with XRE-family HTH domain
MKLYQPLHLYLRNLRTRAGLSQLQLAILSNVDARRVCDYEQGLRKPSPAHLELMAPHLKTDFPALLLHPDLWRSRSTRDKWFQDKHHFWPDIERFGHERLRSAVAAFGPGIRRLVDSCSESGKAFLTLTPSDSSPEWTFQLKHIVGGTEPSLASPLGIQFRRHFVTHPKEYRYVGDCSVPCLIGACANVRYILIPKVSVRTFDHPDFPITMDFLCGVREPRQPIHHLNVEVDGTGHDPRWDARRQKALAMHTVRFTQEDIGRADFLDLFHGRIIPYANLSRAA